jgi:four helix bundle protein
MSEGYRDLKVWRRSIALVRSVYAIVRSLPREETYGLSDQLRRAVMSVPANIAEGQARLHRKEFIQHLSIARGSLAEVDTLLVVAHQLEYIDGNTIDTVIEELAEVRRMLHGLLNRLRDE